MKELKLEVYGRVQGVNFRRFVRENTEKLGLVGFVKNNKEGSVSILAQGKKKDLLELISVVHKGSFLSKVYSLSYFFSECNEKMNNFKVIRDKNFIKDQKKSFFNLGKNFLGWNFEIPKHVAIIPDGNRRWAKRKGFSSSKGVSVGGDYNHLKELFDEAHKLGIKYVSLWGFSTENWKRPNKEIKAVFDLVGKSIDRFTKDALKNKIKFRHLGRKDRLPKKVIEKIKILEDKTKEFDNFNVQICLDYGCKDEIVRAVNNVIKSGKNDIDEKTFSDYLDTSGIPDVDLIIRTSGEKRTSGFMGFQADYAEFYFTDKLFPDFNVKDFREAIRDFGRRKRNIGK